MKHRYKGILFEYAKLIIISIVLSLLVKTYVAEARFIPSESMLPTLKIGDHLIIDKISYEVKGIKNIKRGDIVVFNPPPSAHSKTEIPFIKRIIGLPGETLSVKNGTVYINGEPLNETYILEKPRADFEPYTIPDAMIFLMGDNRNNSNDSRYWGALPIENIIGKAEFRYYPFTEIGTID